MIELVLTIAAVTLLGPFIVIITAHALADAFGAARLRWQRRRMRR